MVIIGKQFQWFGDVNQATFVVLEQESVAIAQSITVSNTGERLKPTKQYDDVY